MDILLQNVKVFRDNSWKLSDLSVKDGKIEAVADPGLPTDAKTVRDFGGRSLSPGWVDLHAHLLTLRHGGVGTTVDRIGPRTGVTGLLDVGTTGAANFEKLYQTVIRDAEIPVRAFLNIKKTGIRFWHVGLDDPGLDDLPAMARVKEKYPEVIRGVKVTASSEHMLSEDPMYYVRAAVKAARELSLPVMIHIGRTPPSLPEILPLMEKGDILTHCFRNSDHAILDESGKILPEVIEARERGVIFDIGHGVLSFSFPVAEQALDQGFIDFTISSDLYMLSTPFRAKSFANVLTKFLALGMTVEDVMERASTRPGGIVGLPRGVASGLPAFLTVFEIEDGDFLLDDCWGVKRRAKRRVRPVAAVLGDRIVECR